MGEHMKPLLYTHNPEADVTQYAVRNPAYFRGVETGFARVVLDGNWPEVAEAYKAAGIEVEQPKQPEAAKPAKTKEPKPKD